MTADELRQLAAQKCECRLILDQIELWQKGVLANTPMTIERCSRCLAVDAALSMAADRIEALEASLRWALGEIAPLRRRTGDRIDFVFCGYCICSESQDKAAIIHSNNCKYARALRALEGAV